jgi:hypothetical protein
MSKRNKPSQLPSNPSTTKILQLYGSALNGDGSGCQDYTNTFELKGVTLVDDRYLATLVHQSQQNIRLLEALVRLMNNDCPLTGDPTYEELVEHWEYERSVGRGGADDQLFALSVIAEVDLSEIKSRIRSVRTK